MREAGVIRRLPPALHRGSSATVGFGAGHLRRLTLRVRSRTPAHRAVSWLGSPSFRRRPSAASAYPSRPPDQGLAPGPVLGPSQRAAHRAADSRRPLRAKPGLPGGAGRSLLVPDKGALQYSVRMRLPEPIMVLEGRGIVGAFEHRGRARRGSQSDWLHLSDDLGLVSAIEKGRSSASPILRICRRIAALSIAVVSRLHVGVGPQVTPGRCETTNDMLLASAAPPRPAAPSGIRSSSRGERAGDSERRRVLLTTRTRAPLRRPHAAPPASTDIEPLKRHGETLLE